MATNQRKIYRFALYGRRNSGKTCILAALAMERIAHPDGLSCTWLDAPPKGVKLIDKSRTQFDQDITASYKAGRDWLQKAIANLEQGTVPSPNPIDTDAYRFLYEFTAKDHRTFLVELIDYSGELIDPDLSDNDLAQRLRQHMLTMDGILILAEAPHLGQPPGELHRELQRLKRAFAGLRGEKQDGPAFTVPVALLINKWDRRIDENYRFLPQNSDKEIEEFLNSQPEPPHRSLVDTLKGSVAEGLFKVFPVSAFGKHIIKSEANTAGNGHIFAERPAQVNPLCSFGLEDPFVWACRCRDQLDIRKFEADVTSRVWWKPWQLINWGSLRELKIRASELAQRFPDSTEEKRRIQSASRRSTIVLAAQLVLTVMIVVATYIATGAASDYWSYSSHKPTFANLEAADSEQLNRAETWLEQYCNNRWLFHLGFRLYYGGESASNQLVAIREYKKELTLAEWRERWKAIEQAPDEVTKEQLAKKLRDDLQASPYNDDGIISKCDSLLAELEALRKIREYDTELQTLEAQFNNLVSAQSEDKEAYRRLRAEVEKLPTYKDGETEKLAKRRMDLLGQINARLNEIEKLIVERKNAENIAFINEYQRRIETTDELADIELIIAGIKRGMPHPDLASPETWQMYNNLLLRAQAKHDEIVRRKNWNKFEDGYHALMRRGNLRDAAQRLVEKDKEIGNGSEVKALTVLKEDFRKRCLPQLEDKKSELVRGKQWDRAREMLKTIRTDTYVKALLSDDQLRRIEDMEHEVDIAEDKDLYARVANPKTRTIENIDKYLNEAPLKTMRRWVQKYRDYLIEMNGKIEFEIEGIVHWGNDCWDDHKNQVQINLNGFSLPVKKDIKSKRNESMTVGRMRCRYKLSDKIKVDVNIVVTDGTFIFSSRAQGWGKYEGYVSDLLGGGITIPLDRYGNKVVLKIEESSLPQEPILPSEWQE